MRVINSAQLTYALTCGAGFYAPNLTTLGTPPAASNEAFISPNLGGSDTVIKAGYAIQMTAAPYGGSPPACNGLAAGSAGQGFVASADPIDVGNSRFFGTNANGLIYEHTATLFGVMPEIGDSPAGHPLR
jgi:hypothetical protein